MCNCDNCGQEIDNELFALSPEQELSMEIDDLADFYYYMGIEIGEN